MKKFRIRLWLVKRLLDSLIGGCLDEFPEFDEISEGVAHLHSAIEERAEFITACRRIIANGMCNETRVLCEAKEKVEGYVKCPNFGKSSSDSWSCAKSAESAKRWLREHGIKEESRSMSEKKRSAITMWQVVPMFGAHVLTGQVTGDSRFEDGTFVRTSKLLRVDFANKEAETLNTIYSLLEEA